MKKLLAIVLCLALMVSLVACSSGWKATLEDYEEFIDEYVEAVKAGDDLTELDKEGEEWTAKIEELAGTLEGEEKKEFEAEAARITMKVLGVAGDMDLGGDTDADIDLGLDELEDSINDLEDALADFDY